MDDGWMHNTCWLLLKLKIKISSKKTEMRYVYMCKISSIWLKSIRLETEIPTSLFTWTLNQMIPSLHAYTCTKPFIRNNHFLENTRSRRSCTSTCAVKGSCCRCCRCTPHFPPQLLSVHRTFHFLPPLPSTSEFSGGFFFLLTFPFFFPFLSFSFSK